MAETDTELPKSVQKKFEAFEDSLDSIQNTLKPFLKMPITGIREKLEDPIENAKLDLMVAYTTNSLFWTYLITQGIDPKTHPVKDELLRIKKYYGKIQAVQDKKKMARIDTSAAKRFVRNALWEPSKDGECTKDATEEGATKSAAVDDDVGDSLEQEEAPATAKSKKRKKQQEDNSTQKKKKKKKKK